jgi:hypothetical protein
MYIHIMYRKLSLSGNLSFSWNSVSLLFVEFGGEEGDTERAGEGRHTHRGGRATEKEAAGGSEETK